MAKFSKSILKVGKHYSPDGVVEVTPERLKNWADTFTAMKGSKLGIPVGWDHSTNPADASPVDLGDPARHRSAKNAAGYLDAFEVAADGQSAILTLDIPLAEDAAKVEANIPQISPVIFQSWKDGAGREWNDCITHVDLVIHPVDASQTPFQAAGAIACSLRMGLDTGKPKVYRMADDSKPDDEKDEGGSSDNGGDDKDKDKGEGESDSSKPDLAKLVQQVVSVTGVVLPEGTDPTSEDGMILVLTAVVNKLGTDNSGGDANPNSPPPEMAMMSLENKAVLAHVEGQHRMSLQTRLDALRDSGRCTPHEHKLHSEAVGAVRLSLDSDGKPMASGVEQFLQHRECCPAGTFWTPEKRTSMYRMSQVHEPPLERGGELSNDDAERVANEFFNRHKPAAASK